jgi:hypothetical protein
MVLTKTETIEQIIREANVSPEKYFDYLADQKEEYLTLLLKILKML